MLNPSEDACSEIKGGGRDSVQMYWYKENLSICDS